MDCCFPSGVINTEKRGWSVLFAKEPEEDLEFDEGLEDDDLGQPQPPSRRPLLWILILIIAAGVGYWFLNPDWSSMIRKVTVSTSKSPVTISPLPSKEKKSPITSFSIPSPHFQEGQHVFWKDTPGKSSGLSRLSRDPTGNQQGPLVKKDEPLTIVDGEVVNQKWAYLVRTQSGKKGWVAEQQLRSKF